MNQTMGTTAVRGSGMDVYTGLLVAAFVVLLAGFLWVAAANMELADGERGSGGMLDSIPGFKAVQQDS